MHGAFQVTGRISDATSGKGIPNLRVRLVHPEGKYRDILPEAITDRKGTYLIAYTAPDYRELLLDRKPELYLEVRDYSGGFVEKAKNRLTYSDADELKYDLSVIDIPGFYLPEPFRATILRAEDLLYLVFEFINLKLDDDRLVRKNDQKAAYIIVYLQPQHLAEQAFYQLSPEYNPQIPPLQPSAPADGNPKSPAATRLADPSRLVFQVPEATEIPYTPTDLLQIIGAYAMKLPPTALPPPYQPIFASHQLAQWQLRVGITPTSFSAETGPPKVIRRSRVASGLSQQTTPVVDNVFDHLRPYLMPRLAKPTLLETAIELPYRLLIAPHKYGKWQHTIDPATSPVTGRTELWHLRYTTNKSAYYQSIRAVWTRDYSIDGFTDETEAPKSNEHYSSLKTDPASKALNPFRMSLDAFDRKSIVHLSANFYIPSFTPSVVKVQQLILSSLGGWLNARGAWSPPLGYSVEEWKHRATLGRDHYVRVVYQGYLFPFGHKASLIKVSERQFISQGRGGGNTAFLRQRMYIVVREPERQYIDTGVGAFNRQNPFTRIELTTLVTPLLDPPEQDEVAGKGQAMFWPAVGGDRFAFHIVAEDLAGEEVEFTSPLIFVEKPEMEASGNLGFLAVVPNLVALVNDFSAIPASTLSGQTICFAPTPVGERGKTSLATQNLSFTAKYAKSSAEYDSLRAALGEEDVPPFVPVIKQAKVLIPALQYLLGQQQGSDIYYDAQYLSSGYSAGEIFVRLLKAPDLDFSQQGDRSGGLIQPSFSITGLSRKLGPVGGNATEVNQGKFDPADYFAGLDAKLFGVINLWDIVDIPDASAFAGNGSAVLPKMVQSLDENTTSLLLHWEPNLHDWNDTFLAHRNGQAARLELDALVVAQSNGTAEVDIRASLFDFSIDLIGSIESFLVLRFEELFFHSQGGKKAEVDVKLADIEFVGVLAFVETLKDFIPLDGFSDPPSLVVDEKGVQANFSLGLPTVAIGVFSLQNVSLGATFTLPFQGDPMSVRFNFCERESPFLLTVMMFGGGGFFALTIDPGGVQRLEAAFEFGANVAVDLGVASGSVYIMAGIYFEMQLNPDKAELTGYLRMGGQVQVMGLVSASIELSMHLKYQFSTGKCVGKASIIVEVEVLLWSGSVEITCERKFAGANGDPTFAQVMSPYEDVILAETVDPWAKYCRAFA